MNGVPQTQKTEIEVIHYPENFSEELGDNLEFKVKGNLEFSGYWQNVEDLKTQFNGL